jgi:uncharacterized membrane protein YeaQ/YmgE (transglycosylase-associated protein family)
MDNCASRTRQSSRPNTNSSEELPCIYRTKVSSLFFVGVIAGWLAGNIVSGGGYGLIGDLIVGVIGAFIGDRLLPRLGIHLGTGMVALIVNATLGAIVLLIILRLITGVGGGGFRRRW